MRGIGLIVLGLSCLMISCTKDAAQSKLEQTIVAGQKVYEAQCLTCHMADGYGVPNVHPPLAGSDYLMADKNRSIRHIIHGVTGVIIVNDVEYDGVMPPQPGLTDQEIADVLTYVRNSWGNQGEAVSAAEVAAQR